MSKESSTAPYELVHLSIEEDLSCHIITRSGGNWFDICCKLEDLQSTDCEDGELDSAYEANVVAAKKCMEKEEAEIQGEKVEPTKTVADSGYGSDHNTEESHDDSASEKESTQVEINSKERTDEVNAKDEFTKWLLQPFDEIFAEHAIPDDSERNITLKDWYNTDCLFFKLQAKSSKLSPVRLHDFDAIEHIAKNLTPAMPLPKYLRRLPHVTWYDPSTLKVVAEEGNIQASIHPTLVRTASGETFFLKLATDDAAHAVKRELRFLNQLTKKDMYEKGINAPRLMGLVAPPSNSGTDTEIMGFLLSLIPQPATPLTELMKESVELTKRESWEKECKRMVDLLHEHDFIWGDAKGDNFMVDKDDKLWIIDFGGSYTVGWIDPEFADTEEGDNQGLKKIAQGLQDPEPEFVSKAKEGMADVTVEKSSGSKRKRLSTADRTYDDEHVMKKAR